MPFRNVIAWHSGDTRQTPENTAQCYVFTESSVQHKYLDTGKYIL